MSTFTPNILENVSDYQSKFLPDTSLRFWFFLKKRYRNLYFFSGNLAKNLITLNFSSERPKFSKKVNCHLCIFWAIRAASICCFPTCSCFLQIFISTFSLALCLNDQTVTSLICDLVLQSRGERIKPRAVIFIFYIWSLNYHAIFTSLLLGKLAKLAWKMNRK